MPVVKTSPCCLVHTLNREFPRMFIKISGFNKQKYKAQKKQENDGGRIRTCAGRAQ